MILPESISSKLQFQRLYVAGFWFFSTWSAPHQHLRLHGCAPSTYKMYMSHWGDYQKTDCVLVGLVWVPKVCLSTSSCSWSHATFEYSNDVKAFFLMGKSISEDVISMPLIFFPCVVHKYLWHLLDTEEGILKNDSWLRR